MTQLMWWPVRSQPPSDDDCIPLKVSNLPFSSMPICSWASNDATYSSFGIEVRWLHSLNLQASLMPILCKMSEVCSWFNLIGISIQSWRPPVHRQPRGTMRGAMWEGRRSVLLIINTSHNFHFTYTQSYPTFLVHFVNKHSDFEFVPRTETREHG